MNKFVLSVLLLLVICATVVLADAGKAPVWKEDLGEKILNHYFLQDGKYIFFTNGEYMWLYDAKSGANVYKQEVDDFEKEGIHQLVDNGTKYLVSSGKKVLCYDPLTGKILWQQEYKGIDQDDFTDFDYVDNTSVLRYGDDHIGFDLNDGHEVWRTEIKYKGELATKGTYNWFTLYKESKMLVIEQGDDASLFDVNNGKKIISFEDFEPNGELVDNHNDWFYKTDDNKFILLVLDDGAAVIDVVNNKIQARHKFDIDGEKWVVVPTIPGCAVLGEEQIVHFNFQTGQITEVKFPLDDIRTFRNYTVNGKDLFVVGMDGKMACVDLVAGKVLWETAKDDKNFEGYAHKFSSTNDGKAFVYGNNILFTYANPSLSGDEKGTPLYLMSVDAFSGKLNYRTKVAHGEFAMSNFTRGLAKFLTSAMTTVMAVGSAGMMADAAGRASDDVSDMMGWKNIGFKYEVFNYGDNVLVAIRTTSDMLNPDTKEDGGEGFCMVDPQSGKIIYKDYFEISADGQNTLDPPEPRGSMAFNKSIVYIPGNERIVAFDLAAGKRLWTVSDKDLKDGFPMDLAHIDDVVYCKFGKIEFTTTLDKDDIKVNKGWNKDPYGFLAIDENTGKILWRVETEEDPGFSTPYFSIERYYNEATKQLYFADEENIYALKLGRSGGKYDWTFNLDKNKVGKIEYDESYAINKTYLGSDRKVSQTDYYFNGSFAYSVKTDIGGINENAVAEFADDAANAEISSTYESWGNHWGVSANHCLRVLYNGKMILAFGPDGIGSVDITSGKSKWVHEWDYDKTEVQLLPQVVGDKILYDVDRQLTLVDLGDGHTVWQTKESKKPGFFFAPDGSYLFSIDDEEIAGYNLK